MKLKMRVLKSALENRKKLPEEVNHELSFQRKLSRGRRF